MTEALSQGVVGMVVNGTCESDWPAVAELARRHPRIVPSFGCHPWRLSRRADGWMNVLEQRLTEFPRAGVGEIGIDRWILDPSVQTQARWSAAMEGEEPATLACRSRSKSAAGVTCVTGRSKKAAPMSKVKGVCRYGTME